MRVFFTIYKNYTYLYIYECLVNGLLLFVR